MMSLATIDLALRSGTAALLLFLTVLLLRDVRATVAGQLGVALALGAIAHAVSAPDFLVAATLAHAVLITVATGNVVVLWLFTRALFDDAFRLRWRYGAMWMAVAGLSLLSCLRPLPEGSGVFSTLSVASNLVALGFIAATVVQACTSWSDDLVESRRRLRLGIVIAAAIYGAVNAVLQLVMGGHSSAIAVTANAALFALTVAGIAYALTAMGGDGLFASNRQMTSTVGAPQRQPAIDGSADRRLADALTRLMADDRIYRHEGVTIGLLAGRLGVPEYRLRRLINQQLGYRNFNVFLNNYRIAEAKAALADPSQAEVPVITIAMDAGFQSLGPFNRAFKTLTGVTPSEYRRNQLLSA